ncbi:ATP-dependent nuclease [Brochothrix thermosphacta]|uniref:Recombination protein F n=1 Tax=Brochothrix thermosphacta TaxID=2756 RepID=A0A2X0QF30_BROTH|nr:AAA family ATPase [Brochothrix thermosphacta]SPP27246.1 Recombination protein F [Brochothrix thermosphacta]
MKLKTLTIENFRNFKNTEIKLSNKNIVFGMNDVGKTNLLWSLRFLLDRKIRVMGFSESDFHQKKTTETIKITLEVELKDGDRDSQNIISKVKGSRNSNELNIFYFEVVGKFEASEGIGIPILFWGNNLEKLDEIPQNGNFSTLDKLFNILYIDPTIDLDRVFSGNRRKIFNEKKMSENDVEIYDEISQLTSSMNEKISSMGIIKSFQKELTSEYKQLKDEDVSIELQSEMAIKGFFSDIHPYLKKQGDAILYPTSGDGRKKILAYSLLNYLNKEYDSERITIYLIEEPENSLHRSMQIALSKQLFEYGVYNYFILSTHSAELLYEMDDASLIRVYSKGNTMCSSKLYKVPGNFKFIKKELNAALATALFSNRVLLIEGPSEKVLFEKILTIVKPTYELEGGYLLLVDGIKFKPYYKILKELNIIPIVKTDNDFKSKRGQPNSFDLIGLNRCLELISQDKLDAIEINYSLEERERKVIENKKDIYDREEKKVSKLEKDNIYISRVDLEHDLYTVIPDKMNEVFGSGNPISNMQNKKLINMLKLIDKLSDEECYRIIEASDFKCLKSLVQNI